jgi:hypothetical protein
MASSRNRSASPIVTALIGIALIAAACGSTVGEPSTSPATASPATSAPVTATPAEATSSPATSAPVTATPATINPAEATSSTLIEYYPDANVREFWRRMARPRPVPNSALPPRHLDLDRFPRTLVDRTLIVAGGPPPDGIPPVDDPSLVPADTVDWVAPEEAVLALTVDDVTHLYPIQIMLWHEIVNDRIGDTPVTVTYCPLCNSAVAYDRRVDDRLLDFGTSGSLYQSALVMYDRQTESLWTHFDGRAVVGDLLGVELEIKPVVTVSWADAVERWPDALVLDRPGSVRPYGTSPYPGYEGMDEPLPGYFSGEVEGRLPSRTRVVGLRHDDVAVAVERSLIEAEGSLVVDVGGLAVRLDHRPGTRSPLDGAEVASGVDIGSITAVAVDPGSGSGTDPDSAAPVPVPLLDTFWFAWVTYNPDTVVVDRSDSIHLSTG